MIIPRSSTFRPLLALAALTLLALPTRAQFILDDGQGHATPTGGTRDQTGGPPPPYRHGPYAYSNGTYGLQGVSGGTVTLAGECTFHYRWAGSGPPPSQAVVHVASNANWHYGSSGSANDGLGDPYVYVPPASPQQSPGGGSFGQAYQIKSVQADGTFDVKLSPNVTTNGVATVAIAVDVTPVTLTIAGAETGNDYGEPVSTGYECLVGQQVQAQVSAGNYQITSVVWTGPANAFESETIGADQEGNSLPDGSPQHGIASHDYVSLNPGDYLDQTAMPFYVGKQETATVQCDINIQSSDGGLNASVSLTQQVDVLAPSSYHLLLLPGQSVLVGDASAPSGIYAGDADNPGMVMAYDVGSMPDFEVTSDKGQFAMVQLVKYDQWQYRDGFSGKQDERTAPQNPTDPYALDSSWPYGNRWYTPGDNGSDNDSPGSTLHSYFIGRSTFFHASDDFADFLAYRPPVGISFGTAHVPLRESDWSWHCEDGRDAGSSLWTDPPGMNPTKGGVIEFPLDQFRWHECFQL